MIDIDAFKAGDQDAFAAVFKLWCPKLLSYLNSKHPEVEAAAHEDMVSEAFYRLFKCKHTIENYKHIVAFLLTVIKHQRIDYWRKAERSRKLAKELSYLQHEHADEYSEELLDRIKTVLKTLPPKTQLAAHAIFFEGHTTKSLAASLGQSPQTIINLRNRAINKMMKSIEGALHKKNCYIRIANTSCAR